MFRRRALPELLVLLLISFGFAGSILAYRALYPDNFDFLTSDEVWLGFFTCVGAFWLGVKIGDEESDSPWLRMLNDFRIGTGLNLIVQALLNYLDLLTRSLFLIVVGGAFAALLLGAARQFFRPQRARWSRALS